MAIDQPEDLDVKRRQLQTLVNNVNGHHIAEKPSPSKPHRSDSGFVLKLQFANFKKSPIYTTDVHPDATRFAAGGMGEDCGRIVVWHINALKAEKADLRVICQMDNHTGVVNCVRWSHKGQYLASGGDDSFVMIWQQTRIKDSENWKCVHTLRKHSGDVFGVNWSPNDAYLASCSVDNTVVIWNAQSGFEALQTLRGHSGLVKGVVWDPIGKYLASQSDDGSLRIWRTSDWKQQTSITEVFEAGDGNTQILRLDWSTDGMNIISAHATNEGRPVAQIIERGAQDGWTTTNYLAGHTRPVVCVRFNPRMFINKNENAPYCVCVTGSRDHTASVWSFQNRRPHVFTGLFKAPIMDISWFPDGYSFMACSTDGTMAYIYCGKLITGTAITKEQQAQALSKLYGKTVVEAASTFSAAHNIVESSIFLDAQEAESQRRKKSSDVTNMSDNSQDAIKLPYEGIPLVKQVEKIMANGRRRITPVFIPEVAQVINKPAMTPTALTVQDERSQGSIVDGVPSQNESSAISNVVMARPRGPLPLDAAVRSVDAMKDRSKPSDTQREAEVVSIQASEKVTKPKETKSNGGAQLNGHLTVPDPTLNEPVTELPIPPNKKQRKSLPAGKLAKYKPAKIDMLDGVLGKTSHLPKVDEGSSRLPETPRSSDPHGSRRHIATPSSRRLPAPLVMPKLQVESHSAVAGSNSVVLLAENDIEPMNGPSHVQKFHKVQLLSGNRARWVQYLMSPVVLVCADSVISVAVCEDRSLSIWCSESGTLLSRTQCLTSPAAFLACSKNSLLVVTTDCKVDLWTSKHVRGTWKRRSLGSVEWMLRTPGSLGLTISEVDLTSTDVPAIALSDQRYFVCDLSDNSWLVAHDESIRLGNYLLSSSALRHSAPVPDIDGPLSRLQKLRSGNVAGKNANAEIARSIALNHMENQMILCRVLKSPTEYQAWLNCYAQTLVDNNCMLQLVSLLDSLLGPPGDVEDAEEVLWEPEILNMKKRDLLVGILPVLGRKTQFERMYLEYKQRLAHCVQEARNPFAMDVT
ncbi:hypothetical protein RvY_06051 [Ramazzottius varieornatus]|uniref:Protein HIRA n=1 Tax=Ramazzottius varieornatus TaxID=947166 RepID=A0A1D1V068_RAMVA|nr:hypothetical protein RvY_06051 [Ramazzottius varieornatus]